MNKQPFLSLFLAGILFLVASCVNQPSPPATLWVETSPIQCLGNPWEQDWLNDNPADITVYPRDREKQLPLIKAYYEQQDLPVIQVTLITYEDMIVCAACSCSDGSTLYLEIPEEDLPRWLSLNFMLSEGPAKNDKPYRKIVYSL
jgi:hypothetical protein